MRTNRLWLSIFLVVAVLAACAVMQPGATPFTPDPFQGGALITLPDGSVILAEDLTMEQAFDYISAATGGQITTEQFQTMVDAERAKNPDAPWPAILWSVGGFALTRKALAHVPLINKITPYAMGIHPMLGILSSIFSSGTGFRKVEPAP